MNCISRTLNELYNPYHYHCELSLLSLLLLTPLDENVALLTPSMIQESGKGIFSKQSHKLTLQNPWAKVALKVFASLEMAQEGPKAKVGAYENVLHDLIL